MYYSEAVEFAWTEVRDCVLGEKTTAPFHCSFPSGAGMELWQCIPESLGGKAYTEGGHTLENIMDLFEAPNRAISSIRKLPERRS